MLVCNQISLLISVDIRSTIPCQFNNLISSQRGNWYGPLKRMSHLLTFIATGSNIRVRPLLCQLLWRRLFRQFFYALISPRTRKGSNHGLRGWQLKSPSCTFIPFDTDHISLWTDSTSVEKRNHALAIMSMKHIFWTAKARRIEVHSSGPIRKLRSGLREFMLLLLSAKRRFFQVILTSTTRNKAHHSYYLYCYS